MNLIKDTIESANKVALAGMKSGMEIARSEYESERQQLRTDCITMALHILGDHKEMTPLTAEVVGRWEKRINSLFEG